MTIHSTKGGARVARTRGAMLVLGATVGVAAVLTACDVTLTTGDEETASPAAEASPAAGDAEAAPAAAGAPAAGKPSAPFEPGHVPEFWTGFDAECGMPVADLASQEPAITVDAGSVMVTTPEGKSYQPITIWDKRGVEPVDYGTEVMLVWSQEGVVVDLGYGWNEGGGLILDDDDDTHGYPTGEHAQWEPDLDDRETIAISGVTYVPIETTCWPGGVDEESRFTSYDTPRADGGYELRAVVVADGRLAVSAPTVVDYVGPAVG